MLPGYAGRLRATAAGSEGDVMSTTSPDQRAGANATGATDQRAPDNPTHPCARPGLGHNGGPSLIRRRGRPSIDSPEVRRKVCDALLRGLPLAVVCRCQGLPSKATLRAWRRRDAAFDRQVQFCQWDGFQMVCERVKHRVDSMCAAGQDPKQIRQWFWWQRRMIDRQWPVPPRAPLEIGGK